MYKAIINNPSKRNQSNTKLAGNLNTPLTSMDSSSRQKVNKERAALNKH